MLAHVDFTSLIAKENIIFFGIVKENKISFELILLSLLSKFG